MKVSVNFKYLFFLIVAFYCLILSQFGMENYDTGYISSFSWRIVNGEVPYQDFIYKFPPVTIYFHALMMKILPETGQFYCFRIFSYLIFSLQTYFIVSGVDHLYNLVKTGINKWGLMIVCFVVSIHNYIPAPWPTTDGLFFGAIAFWIVSKSNSITLFKLFLVALFTILCALSKQSFYLIPIVFIIWIYIRYNLKSTITYLVCLFILVLFFLFILSKITTIENYIKLTTGETHFYDLYYYGIYNFTFIPIKWLVGLISSFGVVVLLLCKTKNGIASLRPLLKWFVLIIFLTATIFALSMNVKIGSIIAFDACLFALVYAYFFQKKTILSLTPLVVLLSFSWSVTISKGYPYPIIFATGIIISFYILLKEEINIKNSYINLIAFFVCLSCFAYNLKPYREKYIYNLNYSLSSISPKLKYIKTNKDNYEKHIELKKLITKYGENFIVAPSFPMANYIFNDKSELPGDWIINTEINRQYNSFIRLAANKKNYIFLEKSFIEGEEFRSKRIEDFSYIAWFIYKKFNPIATTKHFIVYNSLKPNERLP